MKHTIIALMAFCLLFCTDAGAKTPSDDPEIKLDLALKILMRAGNEVISPTNSCWGDYYHTGDQTIDDLLAMELSALYSEQYSKQNIFTGACSAGHPDDCEIKIYHRGAGEDVSSAEIHFKADNGKLVLSSLECVITP